MLGCACTGAGGIPPLLGVYTGAVAGVEARAGAGAGAGAGRLGLLCAEDAFCLAMLASLSRMRFGTAALAGGAAAGLLPEPSEARGLAGGLPGGVVDASVDRGCG